MNQQNLLYRGIQVRNPMACAAYTMIPNRESKTREVLNPKWFWAYILWPLLILLIVIEIVVILAGCITLAVIFRSPAMPIAAGYLGFQLIRVACLLTWDLREKIPSRKKILIEHYYV